MAQWPAAAWSWPIHEGHQWDAHQSWWEHDEQPWWEASRRPWWSTAAWSQRDEKGYLTQQLPSRPSGTDDADDGPTVEALAALLREWGGWRPASAVGHLYTEANGAHKKAIQARGSVSAFVRAHADVFAMEPPGPGENCPSIRLLSDGEREEIQRVAEARRPKCKFYQSGACLKGSECKFSHDVQVAPAPPPMAVPENCEELTGAARMDAIRAQISYYLSDENLRRDSFFQGIMATTEGGWIPLAIVLKCKRIQLMQPTTHDIINAVRREPWVECRSKPGSEAIRRIRPPPALEDSQAQLAITVPEALEPSLEDVPLTLLRSLCPGWKAVVEDTARRSFCYIRRNTWPLEQLEKELELLESKSDWTKLHSKKGLVTRSTAWYVKTGCRCRYSYGDTVMEPIEKPTWLEEIEDRVLGEGCGLPKEDWPNCVNMNLYEDEGQNVGWHSDDEGLFRGCERDCRIISASWGALRTFEVALKDRHHVSGRPSIFPDSVRSAALLPGDLLSMEGLFQRHYGHQVAKGPTASEKEPPRRVRVNLTWRYIVEHKYMCPLKKR